MKNDQDFCCSKNVTERGDPMTKIVVDPKTWPSLTGAPTDLLWSKNVTVTHGGANWPFRCLEERTRELTVLIILPMQLCMIIHQLRLKSQRKNLCFVHSPYMPLLQHSQFFFTVIIAKNIDMYSYRHSVQCLCLFLSLYVFVFSIVLGAACCWNPAVARLFGLFVYWYLCICIFVYLYLCICVFACLEQLVAEILLLPGAETRYVIPCCLRNWQPAEPVFHKYKNKTKYKY